MLYMGVPEKCGKQEEEKDVFFDSPAYISGFDFS